MGQQYDRIHSVVPFSVRLLTGGLRFVSGVRPHKMVAGAPEFVHNFTRDMLRPLVREGALRIIMLGDERMCSGVPAEDVQAVAAAVQSALNSSVRLGKSSELH